MAFESLKTLDENKKKVKETIIKYTDEIKDYVKRAEKDILERLNRRHKIATEGISKVLTKLRDSKEFTEGLKDEGLDALKKHFLLLEVRDNSAFMFGILKRYIEEGVDCTSFESFLGAIPQSEMLYIVKTIKECIFSYCNKFIYFIIYFIYLN